MAKTDGPLPADEFAEYLDAATAAATQFFQKNHPVYEVTGDQDHTIVNLFGGFWQIHIDRAHRRIYEISKQFPDDPLKVVLWESPTLFFRNRTGIRDKLFRWSLEAIEQFLENYDAAKHGLIYVRQKDMLKVPFIIAAQEMMLRHRRVAKAAMDVLQTCWTRYTSLVMAFEDIGRVVWKYLEPDICRYSLMVFGKEVTFSGYNLVWNNIDEVRRASIYVPGVLPIWGALVSQTFSKTKQIVHPNLVSDVQTHLSTGYGESRVLDQRGWKWACRQSPRLMQQVIAVFGGLNHTGDDRRRDVDLANFGNSIDSLPAVLDFLGEVNRKAQRKSFASMLRSFHGTSRTKELVSVSRAAFTASLTRPSRTFHQQEFSLVFDWLMRSHDQLDRNQLKGNWAYFMRRQQQWHIDVATADNLTRANTQWTSLVPETIIDGYTVVPITTAHELSIEGQLMHHCVSSYSSSCETGSSRIFSIRNHEGARLATFELNRPHIANDKIAIIPAGIITFDVDVTETFEFLDFQMHWEVHQIRGVCNQAVPYLDYIASRIAVEYGKKCMELPPKDRFFQTMKPNFVTIAPAVLPAKSKNEEDDDGNHVEEDVVADAALDELIHAIDE